MALIQGARQLPLHHITLRVPWHDNGWNGTVCNNPCNNTSCLNLSRISEGKNDKKETSFAGQPIEFFKQEDYPPCVSEHATFMSKFDVSSSKYHPYSERNEETHGHFAETPFTFDAYSAAAVPFSWMLIKHIDGDERNNIPSKSDILKFDYEVHREPELKKFKNKTVWVQEGKNQRIILDTFFSAIKPKESLVFFYAKATPLTDDPRRVIIGAGRVASVGTATEYQYDMTPRGDQITGFLWERNIGHSIRPGFSDGFIFPYQELLEKAATDETIDVCIHVAHSPDEFFESYSYGSELLQHDGAIASLLECERAVKQFKKTMEGPWAEILSWINSEMNRIWKIRGPFPGFGSALTAFGLEHGTLLAWYIYDELEKDDLIDIVNPWDKFQEVLADSDNLPEYLRFNIGLTTESKWKGLSKTRKQLLELISRCLITSEQATRFYQPTERYGAGIELKDQEILDNPYLLFSCDRFNEEPISFGVVDRGVFPEDVVRDNFPLEEPSFIRESIDPRRVVALCIYTLNRAQDDGHTLLPYNWIIKLIREMALSPKCLIDNDLMSVLEPYLEPFLTKIELDNNKNALQLTEFIGSGEMIRKTITKRLKGRRNTPDETLNYENLVNEAISQSLPEVESDRDEELRAREEKSAALAEMLESRVSVLIGSAGTGKSTLLKALCNISSVNNEGILLLAPTGKARVRLEQATNMQNKGLTLAQFLLRNDRYVGRTGRYFINNDADKCSAYKTVIIDECSMLTEIQLAALLDTLSGVKRYIFVGDPQQLPPIGAGKPFVDVINKLKNDAIDDKFPKVSDGYAELTIPRRQVLEGDVKRDDLTLAEHFSGRPLPPGADEIWAKLADDKIPQVDLITWNDPEDLQQKLIEKLVEELNLDDDEDEVNFGASIGGNISANTGNVFFNNHYGKYKGAAECVENWQILSPLRASELGVDSVNRMIQSKFRQRVLSLSTQQWNKIPRPMGPQGIMWGDKVINVINKANRKAWPTAENSYVANGDIGVVVGEYKKSGVAKTLQVEFAAQTGGAYPNGSPQYKFFRGEFSGESSTPPLELAYALTVHKTQGSEFDTTFLILPDPCRLLSREMLYTAITRHKEKIVILYQGDFRKMLKYSSEKYSEISRRLTNIFTKPKPVEFTHANQKLFLDENLIHRTQRGELVRSKSELIIADKLHAAKIDYRYEEQITLNGKIRYPDFRIEDDDSGTVYYWEHLGMMSVEKYKRGWLKKLADYTADGILSLGDGGGKNGSLIITEEYDGLGLDSQKLDEIINEIS